MGLIVRINPADAEDAKKFLTEQFGVPVDAVLAYGNPRVYAIVLDGTEVLLGEYTALTQHKMRAALSEAGFILGEVPRGLWGAIVNAIVIAATPVPVESPSAVAEALPVYLDDRPPTPLSGPSGEIAHRNELPLLIDGAVYVSAVNLSYWMADTGRGRMTAKAVALELARMGATSERVRVVTANGVRWRRYWKLPDSLSGGDGDGSAVQDGMEPGCRIEPDAEPGVFAVQDGTEPGEPGFLGFADQATVEANIPY